MNELQRKVHQLDMDIEAGCLGHGDPPPKRATPKYPTAIIMCPDCGVECNFVANNFAEMPVSYPGTYHPHERGSKLCLKRQIKNLKGQMRAVS